MKWPWNRALRASQEPDPTLADRVAGLEAAISGMTADVKLLRIEWAEVLDKIGRWASRQSGRLAKQAKENIDAAAEDAPGATISDPLATGRHSFTKADLRRLANQRRQPNGAHQ
jgi:hypothetical protein